MQVGDDDVPLAAGVGQRGAFLLHGEFGCGERQMDHYCGCQTVTCVPWAAHNISCEQCNPLLLVFYTLESRSLIVRLEPEGIDKHLNQVAAVGRCVAAAARGPLEMSDLQPIVNYLQGCQNTKIGT
jgi:hypothetical protein